MKRSNYWWLLTVAGGMLIALGIFSLISPLNAYIFLVHYSGLTLLLNGILLFVVSWKSSSSLKEKDWLFAESMLDILFAACLLFNPFMTFLALALLIGPWMIGKGILKTLAALTLKQIRGWILILFTGLISIISGLLIIFHPLKRASGITVFIGFFAFITGVLYVVDSIRFKKFAYTLDLVI
jgi:uncharacterized membrane protein HdeD (DUF308 family)